MVLHVVWGLKGLPSLNCLCSLAVELDCPESLINLAFTSHFADAISRCSSDRISGYSERLSR